MVRPPEVSKANEGQESRRRRGRGYLRTGDGHDQATRSEQSERRAKIAPSTRRPPKRYHCPVCGDFVEVDRHPRRHLDECLYWAVMDGDGSMGLTELAGKVSRLALGRLLLRLRTEIMYLSKKQVQRDLYEMGAPHLAVRHRRHAGQRIDPRLTGGQ